jgi:hypothetical protein
MTSYLTQTIAREHVAELIAQAENSRVRRDLRRARRAARAAAHESATRPRSGGRLRGDPWMRYLVPSVR